MTNDAIAILQKARDIVAHPGWWTQGQLCAGGAVCAMGAIAVADGLFELDKKKGPQERVNPRVAEERVPEDYLVEYYNDYDDFGSYGERVIRYDPAEWVRMNLDGELTEFLLSEAGTEAACRLSAAVDDEIKGVQMRPHTNREFRTCQERVIGFNDANSTTQERVVAAFDRALAQASA